MADSYRLEHVRRLLGSGATPEKPRGQEFLPVTYQDEDAAKDELDRIFHSLHVSNTATIACGIQQLAAFVDRNGLQFVITALRHLSPNCWRSACRRYRLENSIGREGFRTVTAVIGDASDSELFATWLQALGEASHRVDDFKIELEVFYPVFRNLILLRDLDATKFGQWERKCRYDIENPDGELQRGRQSESLRHHGLTFTERMNEKLRAVKTSAANDKPNHDRSTPGKAGRKPLQISSPRKFGLYMWIVDRVNKGDSTKMIKAALCDKDMADWRNEVGESDVDALFHRVRTWGVAHGHLKAKQ